MNVNVWAVTMVRDEIDIIEQTVRHIASEGIAGLIVADNGSTDGTWEWLNDSVDSLPCATTIERDNELGYYQSAKMTRLAQMAFAEGAEWVVPFDADEIWYNGQASLTIVDTIAQLKPGYHCLDARLFNHFPTSADDAAETNPPQRIVNRDPKAAPLPKVIVAQRCDVVIAQGNHNAYWTDEPGRRVNIEIEVAHFPWRNPDQFERKIRNGYEAYRATDLAEDMGAHWRSYGRILEAQGSAGLREVWDTWFFDPALKLEHKPVPLRRFDPTFRKP